MAERPAASTTTPSTRARRQVLIYIGAVVLLVVLIGGALVYTFTETILNGIVKDNIDEVIRAAVPSVKVTLGRLHYDLRHNILACDTICIVKRDSSGTLCAGRTSIGGVDWVLLIRERGRNPKALDSAIFNSGRVTLELPGHEYSIQCNRIRVAVGDSALTMDSVRFISPVDDEAFFSASSFRRTRFRATVADFTMRGVDVDGLTRGSHFGARYAGMEGLAIDVLINKDKPAERSVARSPMPHEILVGLSDSVRIDSLILRNASLRYQERFASNATPAALTFDDVAMTISGIANRIPAAKMHIDACGKLMSKGMLRVKMDMPLVSSRFDFDCSGSLAKFPIDALNPWVVASENIRVKNGEVGHAEFDVHVVDGVARGAVRPVYRNLKIAILDKKTKSEAGIVPWISSFIANTFKLRGSNGQKGPKSLKTGVINYTHQRTAPFFQFLWFALRGGLADVVGF